jgi:adenylate kinase family enzyme
MRPAFILLHGLPGAGKTTAARLIAEMSSEIFFVDWGAHPEFGARPARTLLAEQYAALADGRSMITEGVLEERSSRDSLVTAVIQASKKSEFPLLDGLVVFLDEGDMELLASRRSKAAEFYAEKRAKVQSGSEKYHWVHYRADDADRSDPTLRAERLLALIAKHLEDGS